MRDPVPYDSLEDQFGDIVAKARRGQERGLGEVARQAGLTIADLERIEAYALIPDAAVIDALAQTLGLHAHKLRDSAACTFFPAQPEPRSFDGFDVHMLVLGTDFVANGYLVVCTRTRSAAVVDPGFQAARVLTVARAAQARIEAVWLTHGHGDHVGGVAAVLAASGGTASICAADLGLTGEAAAHIRGRLQPGSQVSVGGARFAVRATPGHTPGGVSFVHQEGLAFVGDALFAGSLGGTRRRTDYEAQRRAVAEQVLSLPPDTVLCPGHGPATTVGEERDHNPFFDT